MRRSEWQSLLPKAQERMKKLVSAGLRAQRLADLRAQRLADAQATQDKRNKVLLGISGEVSHD